MRNMKKDYVKPLIRAINLGNCEDLLQSSYVDIGGTTDRFNVRGRRSRDIWDDEEDEEYFYR